MRRHLRATRLCSLTAVAVTAAAGLAGLVTTSASAATPATVSTVGATAASTYQTDGIVWALAYANSAMWAGGTFANVRPSGAAAGTSQTARANLVSLNASTGALNSCNLPVTLAGGSPTVRALTASPDGKTLYVGGYFNSIGGVARSNLAAINTTNCTVITSFAPVVDATVRAIAVNPAGTEIYFGGDFQNVNSTARGLAAAVNTSGVLQAWNPDAVAPTDTDGGRYTSVRALSVSSDGTKVAIGGDFDYLNGTTYAHRIGVVDATNGTVLNTFGSLIDPTSAVKALTNDGTNWYLGAEGTGGGVFDGRAAINISTGAVVWKDNCLGATQAVLVSGKTLYSASHAHDCYTTPGGYDDGARHHLLAQDTSNATIQPWFPNTNDGIGEGVGPRALAMSPDGSLWTGGEFTQVNGVNQQGITRFTVKPDPKSLPAAPVPTVKSYQAGKVVVRWKTVADNSYGTLTYNLYRDGTLINTQTGESRFFDRPQLTYVDTVTAGSFHVYRTTVSDGNVTSAQSGTVGITAASKNSTYYSAVTGDSPTDFWRLDDASGSFAADNTGTNPGIYPTTETVTYGAAGSSSDGNTAVTFGGDTATQYNSLDGIQMNNQQAGPTTFSEELWFKTTTTTGGELIGFGDHSRTNGGSPGSANYDRHVYMTTSGNLIFGVYPGYTSMVTSPLAYNDGKWHYVVATLGANGQQLYVDGQLVASSTNTNAQVFNGYWRIGGGNLSGWGSAPTTYAFAGTIDDVAIYPTQLSSTQIAAHYAAR